MNALAMMATTANASLKADAQISETQLLDILRSGHCPPRYQAALMIALTESPRPVITAVVRDNGLSPARLLGFEALIGGYPADIKTWLLESVPVLDA